jgi:hypothetical protein
MALPPLPAVKATKAQDMFTQEATSYAQRTAKGQATPDPWTIPAKQYPKVLAKAGLKLTPTGQIVPK